MASNLPFQLSIPYVSRLVIIFMIKIIHSIVYAKSYLYEKIDILRALIV